MGFITGGDDDDLIVDIEDGALDEGFLPDGNLEIEDRVQPALKSPGLPDGSDDEEDAGDLDTNPDVGAGSGGVDDDHEDARDRAIAEANQRAIEAEARGIMRAAEEHWRYIQSEVQKSEIALSTIEMYINNTTAALAQAKDIGDSMAEIRLTRELQEHVGLKAQIEAARAQVPTREAVMGNAQRQIAGLRAQNAASAGRQVGKNIKATVPIAERWAKQNGWMQTNTQANAYVVNKSNQMVREGWDMNTPGFYAELSRQVEKAFPGLKVNRLQATQKGAQRPQVKSPVAPARNSSAAPQKTNAGAAAGGSNPRRYKLTSADIAAMKRNNLDPHNKVHRTAFAKARIEGNMRDRA